MEAVAVMTPTTTLGVPEEMNMILQNYDSLIDLDISNYDWKCRVRAQSIWKGINRETKEFWGINILFTDDCNCRIHAFVNAKICATFEKDLMEGEIYVLTNFKVKQYMGDETNRPIRTPKHIYFTEYTELKKITAPGIQIEKYAFDFSALEDIDKLADDNRFLVDLVGVVENRRPLINAVKDGKEKILLKFDISNGRSTVKVTFFNALAELCDKALLGSSGWPQIIAIASGKLGRFEGSIYLSNYPATRFYINPDHYSVKQVLQRYEKLSPLYISSPDIEEETNFLTVKAIRELTEECSQTEVSCALTVKKVDEKSGWFYKKCTRCNNEVTKCSGKYQCPQCKRIIPYPDIRFRVFTICGDKTGSIAVILPDHEVQRIAGKAVLDLLGDDEDDVDDVPIPQLLKDFKNRHYTMTIALTTDNICNGSTVYNATQLVDAMELTGNHSPSRDTCNQSDQMSITNETSCDALMAGTPHTGTSSTKVRPRQVAYPISYDDNDDTVAGRVMKNVKKEHT